MAISFVGASVIWKFIYSFQPAPRPQIGLLNSIVTALGGEIVDYFRRRDAGALVAGCTCSGLPSFS